MKKLLTLLLFLPFLCFGQIENPDIHTEVSNWVTSPMIEFNGTPISTLFTYTNGTGIGITGNTFYHLSHTGDATGQTNLTVVALRGYGISTVAPTLNYVLTWNGSQWSPTAAPTTTYYAGTGLTLSGSTFNSTLGTGTSGYVSFWTGTNTQSSDAGLFWDNTNKRLGIGKTNPATALDVNADATINGVTVGQGANSGIHSTAFGMGALNGGTWATSERNTAIGYGALSVARGGYNTAVGMFSVANEYTGYYNTGIGYGALGTQNNASGNTAIGAYASSTGGNTAGSFNTFVGYYSGYSLTTGGSNTFLGNNSGYNASQLVSATNSIAIGNGAYTTASNTVVIGNSSITDNYFNGIVHSGNHYPTTTDIYYLGSKSATSPQAWRGVVLVDSVTGLRYKIMIISGIITAVPL